MVITSQSGCKRRDKSIQLLEERKWMVVIYHFYRRRRHTSGECECEWKGNNDKSYSYTLHVMLTDNRHLMGVGDMGSKVT